MLRYMALSFLFVFPIAAAAQQGNCVQGKSIFQFGYDGGGASMQVRSGKYCQRFLDMRGLKVNEFVIVEAPRHGKIQRINRGQVFWRYVADANYAGPDSFQLRFVGERIDWRTGQSQGPTFVGQRYNVTVVQ